MERVKPGLSAESLLRHGDFLCELARHLVRDRADADDL
jgi:hypothetical protein